MNNRRLLLLTLAGLLVLVGACSQDPTLTAPGTDNGSGPAFNPYDKNGTETLGAPDIAISAGTGLIEAGVGMVGVASGELTVNVPAGVNVRQVLLYWAGGTTAEAGDANIMIEGTPVQGTLIGGPTAFYAVGSGTYRFSSYRADITGLGLVQPGDNTFTVSGFDFNSPAGEVDESNGCSLLVITDDGSLAELTLRDGLDMAYFGFEPTLDATVPQVFAVTAAAVERTAQLVIMAASVGVDRPNRVLVTTSLGEQVFDDVLGSNDGLSWDSLTLPVQIPAGDTSVTVQLVSLDSLDPQGASLGWVSAGLVAPLPPAPTVEISGTVFVDTEGDGLRAFFELGIGNVVLDLTDAQGVVTSVVTDAEGRFLFSGPGGTYTVAINLADHPEFFNADLAASFSGTTPLSVVVSGAAAQVDFGFTPNVDAILADLESGALDTSGESVRYWSMVFRRAIIEEQSNRRAHGHDRGRHRHHRGPHGWCHPWGHNEDLPDGEQLRELLTVVAGLYLPEPYQFTEGRELQDVLRILTRRPRSDVETLYRELLVTELNFAAGLGLVNEADRLGVLIAWGEGLLVDDGTAKSADKAGSADIRRGIQIFEAVNTGGGGGVDE